MSSLYKTYLFKDKDPVIDLLRTIIKDKQVNLAEVANDSGVKETTIWAWLYGVTKRPQHASVKAVFIALDYIYEPYERGR